MTASKPRLPRFSPTRLNLYRFCPRAYLFQYERGLRWGGASPAQSFGGSVHRTLQAFHERGGAGAVSLDDLKTELAGRWSDAGYGSGGSGPRTVTVLMVIAGIAGGLLAIGLKLRRPQP